MKLILDILRALVALWQLVKEFRKEPPAAPVVPPNTERAAGPVPFTPPPPDPRLKKIIEENTPPPPPEQPAPGPGVQKHVSLIDGTVTYEKE